MRSLAAHSAYCSLLLLILLVGLCAYKRRILLSSSSLYADLFSYAPKGKKEEGASSMRLLAAHRIITRGEGSASCPLYADLFSLLRLGNIRRIQGSARSMRSLYPFSA